jgi:hypothetical protein
MTIRITETIITTRLITDALIRASIIEIAITTTAAVTIGIGRIIEPADIITAGHVRLARASAFTNSHGRARRGPRVRTEDA